MKTGGVDNLPCKTDIEVAMVIPNVLELWRMNVITARHNHQFKGITIFGLSLAYKSKIRPDKETP